MYSFAGKTDTITEIHQPISFSSEENQIFNVAFPWKKHPMQILNPKVLSPKGQEKTLLPNLTHRSRSITDTCIVTAWKIRTIPHSTCFLIMRAQCRFNSASVKHFLFLDEKLLDFELHAVDAPFELGGFVGGDGGGDDGTGNAAGTAEGDLAGDKDVRDVLVLAQQRQMQQQHPRMGM